jgi:hypothetical protein
MKVAMLPPTNQRTPLGYRNKTTDFWIGRSVEMVSYMIFVGEHLDYAAVWQLVEIGPMQEKIARRVELRLEASVTVAIYSSKVRGLVVGSKSSDSDSCVSSSWQRGVRISRSFGLGMALYNNHCHWSYTPAHRDSYIISDGDSRNGMR